MLRLFLRLFNIRDYEDCKSCETLKQQLDYSNKQNKELMDNLLNLTKPTVIVPQPEVKFLDQIPKVGATFTRRRGILEDMHRKTREVLQTSPHVASPDGMSVKNITPASIEALEAQLGIESEKESA